MSDFRVRNFTRILVDYSTSVKPGDKVGIIASVAAEPILKELFALILARGAQPQFLIDLTDQDELFYQNATDDLLEVTPFLHQIVFEQFDVLIKLRSETNTRALGSVDPEKQARRQKAMSRLIQAQMRRGAEGSLRWMSTLFPTSAYAMEAEMGYQAYQDFVYRACHADSDNPVAHWQKVQAEQQVLIDRIQGHDKVTLKGPNVDLSVSIKDRIFKNACGLTNMPDGEIFTGPVENSVNGWVRFTYPAVYQGRMVNGVELTFKDGKVIEAHADQNEEFLLKMLDIDSGARYVGEFAIGTNYEINRFSRNILFDEKIGGSFHMALGASYPETGGRNVSQIHWDMICDLHQDSQIALDGDMIYRNGYFIP